MARKIIIFMSIFFLLSLSCFAKEQIDFTKIHFNNSEDIQANDIQKYEKYINNVIKDEVQSGNFKVKLSSFQKEYAYEIIRIDSSYSLFLFGVDKNSNIKLIGKYNGEGIINTAKVDVFYSDNYIEIISQRPFSAFYSELILKCDSSIFNKMVLNYGDPSEETLKKEKELISKGDIKGFRKLENSDEGYISYPSSYQDYGNLGPFAIESCHDLALKQYEKGNAKVATEIMESGIDIFFNNDFTIGDKEYNWKDQKELTRGRIQEVLSNYKDWQAQYSSNPNKLISFEGFVDIFNDFAFFLSEAHQNKEAKMYLEKVIQFSPKRVVAYINLADVNWILGNKQEARIQYSQYLKLLGRNTKNVPKRVFERMVAK
jgi:hypothetical protein